MVSKSVLFGILLTEFLEFDIEDLAAGGAGVLEEAVFLVRDRVHVG